MGKLKQTVRIVLSTIFICVVVLFGILVFLFLLILTVLSIVRHSILLKPSNINKPYIGHAKKTMVMSIIGFPVTALVFLVTFGIFVSTMCTVFVFRPWAKFFWQKTVKCDVLYTFMFSVVFIFGIFLFIVLPIYEIVFWFLCLSEDLKKTAVLHDTLFYSLIGQIFFYLILCPISCVILFLSFLYSYQGNMKKKKVNKKSESEDEV
jgi:hypothetical protein